MRGRITSTQYLLPRICVLSRGVSSLESQCPLRRDHRTLYVCCITSEQLYMFMVIIGTCTIECSFSVSGPHLLLLALAKVLNSCHLFLEQGFLKAKFCMGSSLWGKHDKGKPTPHPLPPTPWN